MAKKSSIEKNNRRRRMAKKFSGRRARLKAIEFTGNAPRERTPTERKGRDSTSFRDKLHSRLLGRCRMAPLPRRKAQETKGAVK